MKGRRYGMIPGERAGKCLEVSLLPSHALACGASQNVEAPFGSSRSLQPEVAVKVDINLPVSVEQKRDTLDE
jgi:hypothetical protein